MIALPPASTAVLLPSAVYIFWRWLVKQGAVFENAKGSHVKLHLNGRQSVLPMHAKELKTGTVEGIKKQLGLKGR